MKAEKEEEQREPEAISHPKGRRRPLLHECEAAEAAAGEPGAPQADGDPEGHHGERTFVVSGYGDKDRSRHVGSSVSDPG